MSEELGGTLHIKGHVHYKGGRDELNDKCRARDDEIDRLRAQVKQLEETLQRIWQNQPPI